MVKSNIHLANLSAVFKSGIHLERSREKKSQYNLQSGKESNHLSREDYCFLGQI